MNELNELQAMFSKADMAIGKYGICFTYSQNAYQTVFDGDGIKRQLFQTLVGMSKDVSVTIDTSSVSILFGISGFAGSRQIETKAIEREMSIEDRIAAMEHLILSSENLFDGMSYSDREGFFKTLLNIDERMKHEAPKMDFSEYERTAKMSEISAKLISAGFSSSFTGGSLGPYMGDVGINVKNRVVFHGKSKELLEKLVCLCSEFEIETEIGSYATLTFFV